MGSDQRQIQRLILLSTCTNDQYLTNIISLIPVQENLIICDEKNGILLFGINDQGTQIIFYQSRKPYLESKFIDFRLNSKNNLNFRVNSETILLVLVTSSYIYEYEFNENQAISALPTYIRMKYNIQNMLPSQFRSNELPITNFSVDE